MAAVAGVVPSLNSECWRGIGAPLEPRSLGRLRASRGLRAELQATLVEALVRSSESPVHVAGPATAEGVRAAAVRALAQTAETGDAAAIAAVTARLADGAESVQAASARTKVEVLRRADARAALGGGGPGLRGVLRRARGGGRGVRLHAPRGAQLCKRHAR